MRISISIYLSVVRCPFGHTMYARFPTWILSFAVQLNQWKIEISAWSPLSLVWFDMMESLTCLEVPLLNPPRISSNAWQPFPIRSLWYCFRGHKLNSQVLVLLYIYPYHNGGKLGELSLCGLVITYNLWLTAMTTDWSLSLFLCLDIHCNTTDFHSA